MTSKLLIHLYKNFANINDYNVPHKYQKKESKNKNEINEEMNKINLNDKNENKIVNNPDKSKNTNNNNKPGQLSPEELNLLINKMNEMIINENNEEKKEK